MGCCQTRDRDLDADEVKIPKGIPRPIVDCLQGEKWIEIDLRAHIIKGVSDEQFKNKEIIARHIAGIIGKMKSGGESVSRMTMHISGIDFKILPGVQSTENEDEETYVIIIREDIRGNEWLVFEPSPAPRG
uniref:Uncharacterized protein n=1 Tax=Chromera velia CCMP2878 TaxID=1169474 RepID=A0A0G4HA39_9ALVE|eukprot:Cvel_5992.t1-p1 / transcript=Cvel_5992.t1 / gene=Cvel_5992 / organism=Chromera_velia_CCMP2878 / gene_product=hypothetical protein / transcript_product=hypothetical protein / location=Cvel_scaffold287:12752-13755(-) / protein_length=130 / sequence_SO=supercontig / SO=protein_coding / is_pseudo=false